MVKLRSYKTLEIQNTNTNTRGIKEIKTRNILILTNNMYVIPINKS